MSAREQNSFRRLRSTVTSPPPSSARQSNTSIFPRTSCKGAGATGASQTPLITRASNHSPHTHQSVGAKGAQDSQTPLNKNLSTVRNFPRVIPTTRAENIRRAQVATQDARTNTAVQSAAIQSTIIARVVNDVKAATVAKATAEVVLSAAPMVTAPATEAPYKRAIRKVRPTAISATSAISPKCNLQRLAPNADSKLQIDQEGMPSLIDDSDSSDDDELPASLPSQNPCPSILRFSARILPETIRQNFQLSAQVQPLSSDDDGDLLAAAHRSDFHQALCPDFTDNISQNTAKEPVLNVSSQGFPFSLPSQQCCSPNVTPWSQFQLAGSFFLDGGSRKRSGSCAFVCYGRDYCYIEANPLPRGQSTNNLAEFQALLNALKHAITKKMRRILVVTDSELVANFLKGLNRIDKSHLLSITLEIAGLIVFFSAIYVSRIPSHKAVSVENDVADALCTWAMCSEQPITHCAHPKRVVAEQVMAPLIPKLKKLSKHAPREHYACDHCLKSAHHKSEACPLLRFAQLSTFHLADGEQQCLGCLSPHHCSSNCFLFSSAHQTRRPVSSTLIETQPLPIGETLQRHAAELYQTDLGSLRFPNNCSRKQFVDYYATFILGLEQSSCEADTEVARKAGALWHSNYRFEGLTIKRVRPPRERCRDPGDNSNPAPIDVDAELAKRALRAAKLIPHARVSDVSKALRTGERVALSEETKNLLRECYPEAKESEKVIFEPKPLPRFAVSRDAVARVILARSPNSHPGTTGITFAALQNFCRWTYKMEDADNPDYRWDILCRLISKIMSGNAVALSDMLLDVLGATFDKNAEKPGAPFSLRNLGIEESILRVAAALVFEEVLPKALKEGFLTEFDFGAGRKAGAEIFGRIAAMLARSGSASAVFDVVKAFNHLRREDIKAAVQDFNHPLLTAIVHFLFSRDSKVSFKCPHTGEVFELWLTKGIHQGNPLSVFIFCLTIAFILRPFRRAHPEILVLTFVDDIQVHSRRGAINNFPSIVEDFIALFNAHGLRFNLSDAAKSSVYSVHPLSLSVQQRLKLIGMRCQNDGIAPCKIAHGNVAFMKAHADKLLLKLRTRYASFQALWPTLIKYDRSLKKPSGRVYEPFLNLVRLSFLSMPTYVLRTLHPSKCVAYCRIASELGSALIQNVLPKFIELPPSLDLNTEAYPDLTAISARVMQLPLSLGGLSLRLANSVADIAYAASCIDCIPSMQLAALKMGVKCEQYLIPELILTQKRIATQIPGTGPSFWARALDPEDDSFDKPMQKTLTSMLNAAEVRAIAELLSAHPVYLHAFNARADAKQEHVSWPLNPVSRARFSLGALSDAEFSRAAAIAIIHPIMAPRICGCGQPLDPAGFHLLSCRYNSYTAIHDCVKEAVAARIKSFMAPEIAPMAVLLEQPVIAHYKLRDPSKAEGVVCVADLVLSLHGEVQQHPVICDFVSCGRCQHRSGSCSGDFTLALRVAALFKRGKYKKYDIADNAFFPLPFGRTNVLSQEIFDFCSLVARHFATVSDVDRKLRATFSRSICVGAARTFNLAVRRLQISAAARVGIPAISALALQPSRAPLLRRSALPKSTLLLIQNETKMRARLDMVLRGSEGDSLFRSPGAQGIVDSEVDD